MSIDNMASHERRARPRQQQHMVIHVAMLALLVVAGSATAASNDDEAGIVGDGNDAFNEPSSFSALNGAAESTADIPPIMGSMNQPISVDGNDSFGKFCDSK